MDAIADFIALLNEVAAVLAALIDQWLPDGPFTNWLGEQAAEILWGLLALASLFIVLQVRRWGQIFRAHGSIGKARRDMAAVKPGAPRDAAPGFVILLAEPVGYGLREGEERRRAIEGWDEALRAAAVAAGPALRDKVAVLSYPVRLNWKRLELSGHGVPPNVTRKAQRVLANTGADILVAPRRGESGLFHLALVPRGGVGEAPEKLSTHAGDKGLLGAQLNAAVGWWAANALSPGAPPFEAWDWEDRDDFLELMAPFMADPPADLTEDLREGMEQACLAAAAAARERDFVSREARAGIIRLLDRRRQAAEAATSGGRE